jgi:FtsP/CotA-like multicopper oxidase with cupredoxin domain
MKEETSIHWHGLVYQIYDGVPYLNTPPKPGQTLKYEFPINQWNLLVSFPYHVTRAKRVYGSMLFIQKETLVYDKSGADVIRLDQRKNSYFEI